MCSIAEDIQNQALHCGFDRCGIIPISALDGFSGLYQKRLMDVPESRYFYESVKKATAFASKCIRFCEQTHVPHHYGLSFEEYLYELGEDL